MQVNYGQTKNNLEGFVYLYCTHSICGRLKDFVSFEKYKIAKKKQKGKIKFVQITQFLRKSHYGM